MGGCYAVQPQSLDLQNSFKLIPFNNSHHEYGILYQNVSSPYNQIMAFQIRKPSTKTINQLIKKIKSPLPNFLTIHSYEIFDALGEKTDYCTQVDSLCVYMEYLPDSLLSDLQQKIDEQKQYNEEQLWSILEQIVMAGKALQLNGESHGDIQLDHIFLTDIGEVKLNHQEYELKTTRSLVPEHYKSNHAILNDVFHLGVTLAFLVLLEDINTFFQDDKIDLKLIQKKLKQTKKHNVFIIDLIFMMINKDRPCFDKLSSLIVQYKNMGAQDVCNQDLVISQMKECKKYGSERQTIQVKELSVNNFNFDSNIPSNRCKSFLFSQILRQENS